ncbi:hypothetical protein GUITHDRAFT_110926 [Guillardia theta CCMP2712]|uniref:Uncharacterized protein n=2 Tax=Guillardia theta TaxID=55529 RepID=L1J3V4_GUITC|nr:hypothetical protein GUITHDRAFT_110926 [Guillardia theta CCMP2712]EKX43201.1 hypothetical protein GUITHDRAFT_110926 [Guillardia theta CCMP2712]|mmetsp:Transcript_39549/g.124386  ORF Transcript_39549/g.124386 Transcript_39549/m.124386 type:complete len:675 (+) Transcript_39549:316-2340(+)|eukprot:XP_005830181.1 hypothetical protein GUITHDRAFT_110926 [Guillardia theta CCMP2712]
MSGEHELVDFLHGFRYPFQSKRLSTIESLHRCWSKRCLAMRKYFRKLVEQRVSLDTKLIYYIENMHRGPDASVFFCARPMQAALSRKGFLLILLAISSMYLSLTTVWTRKYFNNGYTTYRHFKFAVLRERENKSVGSPNVKHFGMMRDGGDVVHDLRQPGLIGQYQVHKNGTINLDYEFPVQSNGFYFITSDNMTERDPTSFTVSGSHDRQEWTIIGASQYQVDLLAVNTGDLAIFKFGQGDYNTSMARNYVESFDLSAPSVEMLLILLMALMRTLSLGVPAVLGLLRREHIGKIWMQYGILIIVVTLCLIAYMDRDNRTSTLLLAFSSFSVFVIIFFFENEMYYWTASLLTFFGWLVLGLLMSYPNFVKVGLIVSLASLFILLYRFHVTYTSLNLVMQDKARYDAGWKIVLEYLGQDEQLDSLREMSKEISKSCQNKSARQEDSIKRVRTSVSYTSVESEIEVPVAPPVWRKQAWHSSLFGNAVLSLDRLFAQAASMQYILLAKVQRWAMLSRGYVSLAGNSEKDTFVLWEEACKYQDMLSSVKWADTKSETRAIEKAVRCYGGDVSRLRDICRQTLVFDDIASVCKCLDIIKNDVDTEIVRITDKMSGTDSFSDYFGRRDVTVNVRLRTKEAVLLGVQGHISEVRLTLMSMAALENTQSHMRYIKVRNLIGR